MHTHNQTHWHKTKSSLENSFVPLLWHFCSLCIRIVYGYFDFLTVFCCCYPSFVFSLFPIIVLFLSGIIEYMPLIIEANGSLNGDLCRQDEGEDDEQCHDIEHPDNVENANLLELNDRMSSTFMRKPLVILHDVQIEPITIAQLPSSVTSTEMVSYQRFGRANKQQLTNPFKCHLCGFSCRYIESLREHFRANHPISSNIVE